jgi:hypothetical protein
MTDEPLRLRHLDYEQREHLRTLLIHFRMQGLSYEEIDRQVGLSAGSSRTLARYIGLALTAEQRSTISSFVLRANRKRRIYKKSKQELIKSS